MLPKDEMELNERVWPIKNGGTGATTAEEARANLETLAKTYTGFIQLGLDRLTVTIEELMRVMPFNAVLYADISGAEADNIDLYPAPHGILRVYKSQEQRASFHFLDTNNKEYTARYAGAWSGWKELFTTEGGTLSGTVKLNNGDIQFTGGDVEGWNYLIRDNLGRTQIRSDNGASNATLFFCPEATNDVFHFWYNGKKSIMFGEHNKPRGTYTGDGSSATREIATGGFGKFIIIDSDYGLAFVGPNGGFTVNSSGTVTRVSVNEAYYYDGKLTLKTTNPALNTNGGTFIYQCL